MTKKNALLVFLIAISNCLYAQVIKNNLEVHISDAAFFDAQTGAYIETYLSINPHSLFYQRQADSTFKATLNVTMLFKNEKKEIVHFDKFQLQTIAFKTKKELENIKTAMLDLRRNPLPEGKYNVEIEIENGKRNAQIVDSSILISFSKEKFSLANIELVDTFYQSAAKNKFSRGDVDLLPMVVNYYPQTKNSLRFYTEAYPINKNEKFILQYNIIKHESGKILTDFSNSEGIEYAPVVPILQNIDIAKLGSGNYDLQVKAFNRNNEVFAISTVPFQRNNLMYRKVISKDTNYLAENNDINNTFVGLIKNEDMPLRLRTILPIAASNEMRYIDNLIIENKPLHMKQFYYNFWEKRNPESPIDACLQYIEQLKIVNSNFGLPNKYGFETDRGRVYLQYGAPNSIQKNYNSVGLLPYEIWDYYALENQTNVQFIFAENDRATNDFVLKSSNKRGEVSDPNWASQLQRGLNTSFDNSGFNANTDGNTLERDLNHSVDPSQSTNTSLQGINMYKNNPK